MLGQRIDGDHVVVGLVATRSGAVVIARHPEPTEGFIIGDVSADELDAPGLVVEFSARPQRMITPSRAWLRFNSRAGAAQHGG